MAKNKDRVWLLEGYNTCEGRPEKGVFDGPDAPQQARDRAREWRNTGHYVQVVVKATS
jgi:hypothetical protein